LIRAPIQIRVGSPNNPTEIEEGLLINLVPVQQFGVVTEISQEPIQLPKSTFGAVQASREGLACESLRFENPEAKSIKRLLEMPPIGNGLNANQEESVERRWEVLLVRMKTGNVAPHGLASSGGE
jgi:hypothetical protein